MVKRTLGVLLSLALLMQPCLAAEALSPTAQSLQALPDRPAPIAKVPNNGVEDFFAVTLISLPFMAFWGLIGALIVGSASQGHFPPEFDTPLLQGAGMAAAGASVATGLVSVQWSSAPQPTPTPQP